MSLFDGASKPKPIIGGDEGRGEENIGANSGVMNVMFDNLEDVIKSRTIAARPRGIANDFKACELRLTNNLTYILNHLDQWSVIWHVRALCAPRTAPAHCALSSMFHTRVLR